MDNKSLIDKIAGKRILSPMETIRIQRLNWKDQIERVLSNKTKINPYLVEEHFPPLITDGQLKEMVTFHSEIEGQAYDGYKWAANLLSNFDDGCIEFGYKGLALINELRHFKSENIVNVLVKSRNNEEIKGTLYDFVGYSYVNQKRLSYSELLESLFSVFNFLVMVTNDILTLNYYLGGLFELPDLRCLKSLEMLFTTEELSEEEKEEQELFKSKIDESHYCYDKVFSLIIDRNHLDFIALMKRELELEGLEIDRNFEENSLNYVKTTIRNLNLLHIYSICFGKVDWNNIPKTNL